jgi:phage tail sheath protein FI
MPEYLAPGVYVEEVDTGSKPIEGVSTSTAGMVGVTERGPENVPVLITGVGEFTRWYGGLLRPTDYEDHRFLPHAVEGFFTNGGKRVYVNRVLDAAATRAASPLFDRGSAASISTTLVRPAGESTGSAVSPPSLVVLAVAGVANGDWVRIGDGSTAEYRQADGVPAAETVLVPVHLPLARSHAGGENVSEFVRAAFGQAYTLEEDAEPGSRWIAVRGTSADIGVMADQDWVEIGTSPQAEYRQVVEHHPAVVVSGTTDSTMRIRLDAPLVLGYSTAPGPVAISRIDLTGGSAADANIDTATAGSGLFYVDDRQGNFDDRANLVVVGDDDQEMRRIGELAELEISPGAYDDYVAGTLVEAVEFGGNRTLSQAAAVNDTELVLQAGETAGLAVGQRIVVDPTGQPETFAIQGIDASTDTLTVTPAVGTAHAVNDDVVPAPTTTTAAAPAGGRVLALSDRMGIDEGTLLRVGLGPSAELVTVGSVPTRTGVGPDPGNVTVNPPLSRAWPAGTTVEIVGAAMPIANRQACALALPAVQGAADLYVTDGDSFAQGELVRLTSGGTVTFHTLGANGTPLTGAGANAADRPLMLTLQGALVRAHPSGSAVVGRDPVVDVEALDAGIWGNRLRISVEDETPGLVTATTLQTMVNATTIRLASASGVQPGTVLEFFDATGPVGDPVKVSNVNRSAGFTLTLAGAGLAPLQQVPGIGVRSREFRITVRLLRQPDPRTPSRDSDVTDSEMFRYLSLDPRHSNYIEKVVGASGGPLRQWDRRPEGSSLYIRVGDRAANQADRESVRLGPEALVDVLPNGQRRAARMRLEQVVGFDSIGTLTDDHYIGADNADPDLRTGLQSLRNVEQISIVGIPGRVSPRVQQALVDHCELLRYRFAVLDSRPEPTDTITDTQDQRQQFDTKYAALYYPWLSIPDPFPEAPAPVPDYAIPPAGHVLGVYARTDIDRGVHKAPANEVVRGIVGLRRKVNKEQQDILNPYPVNINVIRDFRDNNRGIRVYGGRVITSDPDWKYVNVRRLLIFIEASIERGLQWVVFEPNAEPLWARVRRVITNFLTVVWRNGALEGIKPEEAFFVKCDRTTMTQTEIDNGQLIVLVGVAPVKPAEFVIVRIGLWTARSDS